MEEDARNDPVLLESMKERAEDGIDAIMRATQVMGGKRQISPAHFFTRDNLDFVVRREQDAIAMRKDEIANMSVYQTDSDLPWGGGYLVGKVRDVLNIREPDRFGVSVNQFLVYTPSKFDANEPFLVNIRDTVTVFKEARDQFIVLIQNLDRATTPQAKSEAFAQLQNMCGLMRSFVNDLSANDSLGDDISRFKQAARDSDRGNIPSSEVIGVLTKFVDMSRGLAITFGQYLSINEQAEQGVDDASLTVAIDNRYNSIQSSAQRALRSSPLLRTFGPSVLGQMTETEFNMYWSEVSAPRPRVRRLGDLTPDMAAPIGLSASFDPFYTEPGEETEEVPEQPIPGTPPRGGPPAPGETPTPTPGEPPVVPPEDMPGQMPEGNDLLDTDLSLLDEDEEDENNGRSSTTSYYFNAIKQAGVFKKPKKNTPITTVKTQPTVKTQSKPAKKVVSQQLDPGVDVMSPEELYRIAVAARAMAYDEAKRTNSPRRSFVIGSIPFIHVPNLDVPEE